VKIGFKHGESGIHIGEVVIDVERKAHTVAAGGHDNSAIDEFVD
jgi:hypothetical protein